ncbi:hypothetical protein ACU686_00890, partial [Yinghuangia aomiensis]
RRPCWTVSAHLGDRMRRIPDQRGVGELLYWVQFQTKRLDTMQGLSASRSTPSICASSSTGGRSGWMRA